MSNELDIDTMEQQALAALRNKLGVRARTLQQAMKRAGRRMPKDAHRAAGVLIAAQASAAHPKLARMQDWSAVEAASQTLHTHLEKIDPQERRKAAILSMLGAQAFNVLAVFALVIALLMWRGLL